MGMVFGDKTNRRRAHSLSPAIGAEQRAIFLDHNSFCVRAVARAKELGWCMSRREIPFGRVAVGEHVKR